MIVGDFTAATVVAHEYGHNVVFRIAQALNIPDSAFPQGNNRELIADCFAGNWAATVFDRDDLSVRNILQAATLLPLIGDSARTRARHGPRTCGGADHGVDRESAADVRAPGTAGGLPHGHWPEKFSA